MADYMHKMHAQSLAEIYQFYCKQEKISSMPKI